MEAITSLSIENGTYHITSGDGSNNSSTKNDWGFWGNSSREQEETTSAKGIKADGTITIKSGSFNIDSSDDSVHSNNNIEIQNGTFDISSGDDGIHADNILTIEDGEINIKKSYEGLEASTIYLNGGKTTIKSSDDGINAGGGNDSSSMSRPGANQFSNNNYKIIIRSLNRRGKLLGFHKFIFFINKDNLFMNIWQHKILAFPRYTEGSCRA